MRLKVRDPLIEADSFQLIMDDEPAVLENSSISKKFILVCGVVLLSLAMVFASISSP